MIVKMLWRYNLLWVLCILMLLPGFFFLLSVIFGEHAVIKFMRPQYKLHGITTETSQPIFNLNHFKSHDFQKEFEDYLAAAMPLRSLFIRINNQFFYSFFKKSFSYNNQIIIGKSK